MQQQQIQCPVAQCSPDCNDFCVQQYQQQAQTTQSFQINIPLGSTPAPQYNNCPARCLPLCSQDCVNQAAQTQTNNLPQIDIYMQPANNNQQQNDCSCATCSQKSECQEITLNIPLNPQNNAQNDCPVMQCEPACTPQVENSANFRILRNKFSAFNLSPFLCPKFLSKTRELSTTSITISRYRRKDSKCQNVEKFSHK